MLLSYRTMLLVMLAACHGSAYELELLFTSDLRGNVLPVNGRTPCSIPDAQKRECVGGAARRAEYIHSVRSASPHVALLDTGYSFYGSLYFKLAGPTIGQSIFNSLEYDFLAIDAGDFHGGSDTLASFVDGLLPTTTAVMTNVDVSADPHLNQSRTATGRAMIAPWAVKTIGSRRVGMINVVNQNMKRYSAVGAKDVKVNVLSAEAMVRAALFELKSRHPDAKIIVAVCDDDADAAMISSRVENVDVVISRRAAGDISVSTNIFGQRVATVKFGPRYGTAVGHVSLSFDPRGDLQSAGLNATFKQLTNETALDSSTWAFTVEKTQLLDGLAANTVGRTATAVYGERGVAGTDHNGCRFGDCSMARLANDAFFDLCTKLGRSCDLAMINGGAIRGSFDAGNISSTDLMRVFPFEPDPSSIVAVTGDTLMQALEHMTKRGSSHGSTRDNTGAFLHFKGLRYAWNPALPENRIVSAEVYDRGEGKWKPLKREREYIMIGKDYYLASGGDDYTMFPGNVRTLDRLMNPARVVLSDYLQAQDTLSLPTIDELASCNDGRGVGVAHCRVIRTPAVETWYGPCPAGHFRDKDAEPRPVCRMCQTGTYIDNEAAALGNVFQCRPCAPGTYAEFVGSTHCSMCPLTHYSSSNGSSVCESCPAGSMRILSFKQLEYGSSFGVSKEQCECQDGYYVLDGRTGTECAQCPEGAVCRGSISLPSPKQGYWADLSQSGLLHEHLECRDANACQGGGVAAYGVAFGGEDGEEQQQQQHHRASLNSSAACFESPQKFAQCAVSPDHSFGNVCSDGHTGRLCGVCSEGWYRQDNSCLQCNDVHNDAKYIVLLIFLVCLPIVGLVLFFRYGAQLKRMLPRVWALIFDVGRAKVVLSTVQIVGSINSSTDVVWPEPFASLSRVYEISMVSPFNVLPMGCAMSFTYYDELLFASLLPLGLVAALFMCCCCRPAWAIRCKEMALFVMFVFLPSTSLTLFKLFLCQRFADGRSFLSADLSLQCYTPTWTAYAVYASLMILVYPILVPLGFYRLLTANGQAITTRKPNTQMPAQLKPLSFLFVTYKASCYRAEVLDCYRRITLCGLIVFLGGTSVSRCAWGLVLSQAFIIAFREYMPFAKPSTNALAVAAHWSIIFTYFIALILSAAPTSVDNNAIGVVLVLANIAIFVLALLEQLREAKAKLETETELRSLRAQVAEFQKNVLNVVVAQRSISLRERRRFMTDDWAAPPKQMTAGQLQNAANAAKLDTVGVIDRHELERQLEVSAAHEKENVDVHWYWAEDHAHLANHDPACVLAPHWVRYADSVGAQLEYRYREGVQAHDKVVDFDVNNRVVSLANRAKQTNAHTGTVYRVDVKNMQQVNAQSGHRREVLRVEEKKATDHIAIDIPGNAVAPCRGGGGTVLAADGAQAIDWSAGDALVPKFPHELSSRKEPLLLLKEGQLVQVQKKRDDGWWYGFVASIPTSANSRHRDDGDDDEEEDEVKLKDSVSGWFPAVFTGNPSVKQLVRFQEALGGGKAAVDALAPPPTWSNDVDPTMATRVRLNASAEYQRVVDAFKKTQPNATVVSVERIQNLGLWQSYAAKRQTLLLRGKAEGVHGAKLREYERPMLFHGTSDWASAKIIDQGFNRSFCGKNATAYGKGVYFALNSSYSASDQYSPPAGDGIKRMFVCNVLTAETCRGKHDQLVPDARKGNLLFDSTTDNMANPNMFITYHDAQAYPAYIIQFRK